MAAMATFKNILRFVILGCRVAVGCVIMVTGAELIRGEALLSGSQFGGLMTGIFVIALGLYCVLAGIAPHLFHD